jgi:hypothetical protein
VDGVEEQVDEVLLVQTPALAADLRVASRELD